MEKNKKLCLFTIGPVQTFITNSKKTNDFYNASSIIKAGVEIAIKVLKGKGGDILFPKFSDENGLSIPNYFIAEIEKLTSNGSEESIEIKIYEKIVDKFIKIIKETGKFHSDDFERLKGRIKAHIKDTLECRFIWVDYNNDYNAVYKNLMRKMQAVKNTRPVYQLIEENRRCTVCGERESLEKMNLKIQNKEYLSLCCSCLLKRLFNEKDITAFSSKYKIDGDKLVYPTNFSTEELATLSWFNNVIKGENGKEIIEKISDESIKVKNNNNKNDNKYGGELHKKITRILNEETKKGLNEENKKYKDDQNPSNYYAVIRADFDDLGKWFSGKYFDAGKLFDNQEMLSSEIKTLGSNLDQYIKNGDKENVLGKAVYIGGDDILCMTSVDYIDRILNKIHDEIDEINKNKKWKRSLTASISVVIAYHKNPLGEVIQLSNTTLKNAKKRMKNFKYDKSKNGLAICYVPTNGSYNVSYFYNRKFENIDEFARDFKRFISQDFIHEFSKERQLVLNDMKDYSQYEWTCDYLRLIMKRLIHRKNNFKVDLKQGETAKDYNEKIYGQILQLLDENCNDRTNNIDFENFINMLGCLKFYADEKFSERSGEDADKNNS